MKQDPRTGKYRRAIDSISDAFRPVLLTQEGSAGRQATGTALVVADGDTRFVITAEHVVRGSDPRSFGVTREYAVPWPRRYSKLVATGEDIPDADLAWATATVSRDDTALRAALPMALARAAIDDSLGPVYVAVGYPVSKAKVRQGEGKLAAKLMSAVIELAPPEKCRELGLDDRVQIAFAYSQEPRTNLQRDSIAGAHPRGMSGGAVMVMMGAGDDSGAPPIPFLVGILTEYHKNIDTLVATRVRHLWNAVDYRRGQPTPLYLRADA